MVIHKDADDIHLMEDDHIILAIHQEILATLLDLDTIGDDINAL